LKYEVYGHSIYRFSSSNTAKPHLTCRMNAV